MKKITYTLLLLVLIPFKISAMELPNLYSDKVVLYDPDTEEVLYEVKSEEEASIASLTKIMTTIVAIENIEDLDKHTKITKEILSEIPYDASVAGLKLNDDVTYRDLLYASILPSGADATTALAHGVSGTTEKYIDLMNRKAEELGLKHTHFSNVTGYDIDNHYSTANEVLKLLIYSLKNSTFNEIYKTNTYTLSNGLKVESTVNKYNRLLKLDTSSIIGSKTGFTGDAGLCMSAIIKTNDKELLLVTLGADYLGGKARNLLDTLNIVKYLDDNYKIQTLYAKDDELFEINVKDSKEKGMSGICTLTSKKKKPFLGEKKFFLHYGFEVVDEIGDYELLALSFDDSKIPQFCDTARCMKIDNRKFTIYYSPECPYTQYEVKELTEYARENHIEIRFIKIDSLEKAKSVPCVFQNWANFYQGKFISNTILNANSLKKLLSENNGIH